MSRFFSRGSARTGSRFLPFLLGLSVVFFCSFVQVAVGEQGGSPRDQFGGPQAGDRAPDFRLKDLQGREVTLKEFKGKRPVVLITGSYTCPIYRQRISSLEHLYQKYGKRVAFFILYTVEAHPLGAPSPYSGREWITEENRKEGILFKQPSSYEERCALVSRSRNALRSSVPVLVDDMDNGAWEQYGGAPNAAYLIDDKGNVRLRQGWFDPPAFEKALMEILQEDPPRW